MQRAYVEQTRLIWQMFEQGHISELPQLERDVRIEVSDGWEIERMIEMGEWELFRLHGKAGHTLRTHRYESGKVLLVQEGAIFVNDRINRKIVAGGSETFEADEAHSIEAIEDCTLIAAFYPPITVREGEKE